MGRYTGSLPQAQLLYARALYLNGALDPAGHKVAEVLQGCPQDGPAQLLSVSIFMRQVGGAPAEGPLQTEDA
jgi:hypothetical protein